MFVDIHFHICVLFEFLFRTEVNIDPLLQENLVKTMLCLEDTYFSMAEKITTGQNALVICDRGTMDASAFISAQEWAKLLDKLSLEESHICENRYDQVVHMASLKRLHLILEICRRLETFKKKHLFLQKTEILP